jgi:hypothetical protein
MREVQTVETAMGKAPFKAEEEGIGYMDLLGKFGRGAMSVGREALTQMGQMMTAMDEPQGGMPSLGQVPMTPTPVMGPSEAEPRIVLEPQYLTTGGKGTEEEARALAERKRKEWEEKNYPSRATPGQKPTMSELLRTYKPEAQPKPQVQLKPKL